MMFLTNLESYSMAPSLDDQRGACHVGTCGHIYAAYMRHNAANHNLVIPLLGHVKNPQPVLC
jgi:hypothetical protein